MTTQLPGMDPSDLIAEIDSATERLVGAPVVDQKREFVSNVYPLLRLLAESAGGRINLLFERLDGVELAVAEYLTGQESMILPELASRIQVALGLGFHLADAIEKMFAATHQALVDSGQELPEGALDIPPDIANLIVAVRQVGNEVSREIDDVTAESVDDDEPDPINIPIAETPGEESSEPTSEENTDA